MAKNVTLAQKSS